MNKSKQSTRGLGLATLDLITGEILNPSILVRPPRKKRKSKSYARYTNTRSVAGNSLAFVSLICSGLALALVAAV